MKRREDKPVTPWISTAEWISLEMKRFIETTETPGKYGFFDGNSEAA